MAVRRVLPYLLAGLIAAGAAVQAAAQVDREALDDFLETSLVHRARLESQN